MDTSSASAHLRQRIAAYLEAQSVGLIEALCITKNFDDPILNLLSKDFKWTEPGDTICRDRDAFIEFHKTTLLRVQCTSAKVLNVTPDVDELKGRATVALSCRVGYLQEGLQLECVSILTWQRRTDAWLCCKRKGLYGAPELGYDEEKTPEAL